MQHECSATPCLSTPQRSTRGVAPRNKAARVAKATMDLFQKTNEMQKEGACGGPAIFNVIARRVTRAEHSTARASHAQSLQIFGDDCIPLRGGEAEKSDGLCSVLRDTFSVLKHVAQVELTA